MPDLIARFVRCPSLFVRRLSQQYRTIPVKLALHEQLRTHHLQQNTMSPRFVDHGVGYIAAGFVIFWCTGYVVAKLSLPDAGPVRFLAFRFGLACIAMVAIASFLGSMWPRRWQDVLHALIVGVLVHGIGLGGVWVALDRGIEAGIAALIMGTQPLLTALFAAVFLGERISQRSAIGLFVGFAGVALVVYYKLANGIGSATGLLITILAVLSLTTGTLYQTRRCAHLDLAPGNAIQLLGATALALILIPMMGERAIHWSPAVVFSLAWSVLVLSIATAALFYWLFRRGAASQVASLLYLVPPLTALIAWADFGESLVPTTIAGMALTACGVSLVLGER